MNIPIPGERQRRFLGIGMRQAQRVSTKPFWPLWYGKFCGAYCPKPLSNSLKALPCCYAIRAVLFANFDVARAIAMFKLRLT